MGKLIISYWDIRGLAEAAKLMLEYGGVEYEDKRYFREQEPPFDGKNWFDVKFTLGLDFPNLPYLIDGDVRITESRAIYRYIARKIGISNFDSEKAQAECDMLEGVVDGFRANFTSTCYHPEFESKKAGLKDAQIAKLEIFEKFLQNRKFLTGDKITSVDFSFFETLDQQRTCFTDILSKFPNVKGYMERFESLDKIAAYRKSDRFQRMPINNPQSQWGK